MRFIYFFKPEKLDFVKIGNASSELNLINRLSAMQMYHTCAVECIGVIVVESGNIYDIEYDVKHTFNIIRGELVEYTHDLQEYIDKYTENAEQYIEIGKKLRSKRKRSTRSKETERKYKQKYREKHRDKYRKSSRESMRKYRKENPEEDKKKRREYYQKNKEKYREYRMRKMYDNPNQLKLFN